MGAFAVLAAVFLEPLRALVLELRSARSVGALLVSKTREREREILLTG
jgi:hypothetical protein